MMSVSLAGVILARDTKSVGMNIIYSFENYSYYCYILSYTMQEDDIKIGK